MAEKKSNQTSQIAIRNEHSDELVTDNKTKPNTSSDQLSPTYNLKAVVNETGLKPDTLRAWERRYGLPSPKRTAGGHRLYSQRDVSLLKWLINRQEEGLSISRAVGLWNQIESDGRNPLSEHQIKQLQPSVPVTIHNNPGDNITALRLSWIDACLNFDERQAESILAEAFSLFPIETVCFSLLQKGLSEIGIGWYEGRVTVQQEHFASALATRRLDTMVASTPAPTRNGRILVACPEGEIHTFSMQLITLLLRRNGWDVIYLGANVPTERLKPTLHQAKPHLVILASQTLYTASKMLEMAKLLQEERIVTAYGGAVFNHIPALTNLMPGYFLGEQIKDVPQMVEQLLTNPPPMPVYSQASETYRMAMEHFLDRQALIEARLWEHMKDMPHQKYLKNANRELGQNVVAALTFGNIDLMHSNLEWVRGLLANYHYKMPDAILKTYIQKYSLAACEHLDDRGSVLKDWLQRFDAD
ncbi:MAG: methanogenic corrinoid protein MtbC1 [Candidatus Promineifilaceae bacterium]|jgi:methanogenic corrinoid protein MtbC1